jgi:hypothetical protein
LLSPGPGFSYIAAVMPEIAKFVNSAAACITPVIA